MVVGLSSMRPAGNIARPGWQGKTGVNGHRDLLLQGICSHSRLRMKPSRGGAAIAPAGHFPAPAAALSDVDEGAIPGVMPSQADRIFIYTQKTSYVKRTLKRERRKERLGRLVDRGIKGLEIAEELLGGAAPGELQSEIAAGLGGDREGMAGG
ncbi:MAG TPA: hypothetical protein VIE70_04720, partial [Dongiaceae bacterium]